MKKTPIQQMRIKTIIQSLFATLLLLSLLEPLVKAQTFTMGKKCKEANTTAIALLKEKKYQEALDVLPLWKKAATPKMRKKP